MKRVSGRVSKRYARALFEVYEAGQIDSLLEALNLLATIWERDSELRGFLRNPAIPIGERTKLLHEIAELLRKGDPKFQNFLMVLLSGNRLDSIPSVCSAFKQLIDEYRRILALEIRSAFTLPQDERSKIEVSIRDAIGSKYSSLATINWVVDKDLIGGLLIRSGDKLLDGSVRGTLERMGQALAE